MTDCWLYASMQCLKLDCVLSSSRQDSICLFLLAIYMRSPINQGLLQWITVMSDRKRRDIGPFNRKNIVITHYIVKVLRQTKGECTFEPTNKDTNHLGVGIVGSNKLQDRRGHGAIDKKTTSKTKGKFLL